MFVAFKMNDLLKVVTVTNDTFIISIAVVSKPWLDTLPPDLQKIVIDTGAAVQAKTQAMGGRFHQETGEMTGPALGGTVHTLPADDLAQMKTLLDPVGDARDQGSAGRARHAANGPRRRREELTTGMREILLRGAAALMAVLRVAAGAMLIASVGINFANIIGRYFFSVSLSWAEEAMLFLMIGCVFLGAGRSAGWAAISAWTSSSRCCRRGARKAFELFSDLVTIATCVRWRSSPGRS